MLLCKGKEVAQTIGKANKSNQMDEITSYAQDDNSNKISPKYEETRNIVPQA